MKTAKLFEMWVNNQEIILIERKTVKEKLMFKAELNCTVTQSKTTILFKFISKCFSLRFIEKYFWKFFAQGLTNRIRKAIKYI